MANENHPNKIKRNAEDSAKTATSKSPTVTNYDEFDYDYSTFWSNRSYEHEAEQLALKKGFKNLLGDWFIDIGGSYGRNIPIYRKKFHNCVLMDYSMQALQKARKELKDEGISNVKLVAANVYNLPFKTNTFDGGMMIRVLHHIEKSQKVFDEIADIIKPEGNFILEFANKIHIKAVLKALLHLKFKYIFSRKPYLQPSKGALEGAGDEAESIIYNFHPGYITKNLKKRNFKILKRYSASFLRIPFIKKTLSTKLLMNLEKIFQFLFSWTQITPSVIYKTQKHRSKQEMTDNADIKMQSPTLTDLLCCPKCKNELLQRGSRLICNKCDLEFRIKGRIYDLRYPRPEHLS